MTRDTEREAYLRDKRRREELEQVDAMAAFERARQAAKALSPQFEEEAAREAERQRLDSRWRRLWRAGVEKPERGGDLWQAYERIVRARHPVEAAVPDHAGSRTAVVACEALLRGRYRTVILNGLPGRGKTIGALWAICGATDARVIRMSQVKPIPAWDIVCAAAETADVLLINDLTERLDGPTPEVPTWRWEQIAQLLEGRADDGRRTILTTNLTLGQLGQANRLGHRMASRLESGTLEVTCGGWDLRQGLSQPEEER